MSALTHLPALERMCLRWRGRRGRRRGRGRWHRVAVPRRAALPIPHPFLHRFPHPLPSRVGGNRKKQRFKKKKKQKTKEKTKTLIPQPRGTGRGDTPHAIPRCEGGQGHPALSHIPPAAWGHEKRELPATSPAPHPPGPTRRAMLRGHRDSSKRPTKTQPYSPWGPHGGAPRARRGWLWDHRVTVPTVRDTRGPHTNPPPAQPGVFGGHSPFPHRHAGTSGPLSPPRSPQPPSRPPTSKDPIYPLQPLLSPANSRLEQAAPPGP